MAFLAPVAFVELRPRTNPSGPLTAIGYSSRGDSSNSDDSSSTDNCNNGDNGYGGNGGGNGSGDGRETNSSGGRNGQRLKRGRLRVRNPRGIKPSLERPVGKWLPSSCTSLS